MTTQVCPYLRTVDDPDIYIPAPDVTNRCDAISSDGPARIPLDFQGSMCLADRFDRCSRYEEADRRTPRSASRFLVVGGGLGALVLLAGCALLAILALILVVSRPGFLARVTDTPQPTATPSPTWTPETTPTPTEAITNTATATPQPLPATPTVSPAISPGDEFVSPLATPTPPPTANQLPPTATRRPWPTATRRLAPTATRTPIRTPSVTPTRTPTATPQMTCRTGDTMTFNPASPMTGVDFTIEVRSLMGYTDVSLTGGSPKFLGTDVSGSYYIWRWEDSFDTAGTYTYSFQIRLGTYTCITKSVVVVAPTNTPSPTATEAPAYNVGLDLAGDPFRLIYTATQEIFALNLTNGGNVTDTFQVWLETSPPQGLTAQYCIGSSCSDHTVSGMQVTLLEGGSQALSIKIGAAADAPLGYRLTATLWVQSLGDLTKKQSQAVEVVVTANRLKMVPVSR